MRITKTLFTMAIATALGLPATGRSQDRPSQQVPIGPRAIAMGGAYSSIADDASAIFWNPAGLPWIGHQEITTTHADLFGTGIKDNVIAFALSLSPQSAAAVDWYHSGYDDEELGFGESRIDLSYGRRIVPFLSAGATVKYLNRGTRLDAVSVREGHGFGLDVGMIATPLRNLRAGVIGQDLFDTNISYSAGDGTTVAFPMNFRGSVSYSPTSFGVIAFDFDDRWHAGAEFRLLQTVALRAGLQDDWDSPDGLTWSVGAGIRAGLFRFDYALEEHPTLGDTHHFGLAMEFNFNPSQIRIEKVEPRDLFASFHKTYARQPVATVRLRNLDDRPLEARLRVVIPELSNQPTEQDVILRPGATEEVAVSALLGDRVMERTENRSIRIQVSATYQSARLPRTESASAKGVLYGPGAVDWSKGVDQAAAFITARDPAVDALAREATHATALLPSEAGSHRNITFSAAIVDALASLGMAYVPDPNNPYSAISATPRAVDTIAYPRETLARRGGDCDDSSVLMASLLGNVGIATKLVDVPGHVFLLVDTGIHERNRLGLGLEESRTVVADERVWIPLETTAIGRGFLEAWQEGAESFAAWSARGRVSLVDVEKAFERYEPAEPRSALPEMPALDAKAIQQRVSADLGTMGEWRVAYLRERYGDGPTDGPPSVQALNEIARVHFSAGKLTESRATLERALALRENDPSSRNNLGVVLAAQGDLEAATTQYQRALEFDREDAGVWLNLGLARYAMGDTTGAEQPLAEGIQQSGGYEQACALLALAPATGPEREGTRKMTEAEARELLKSALRKVPRPGATVPGSVAQPPTTRVPAETWTSRVAAGRSADRDALREHLYWKER